jgi:primosomal protein N' (replication factor Y)
MYFYEVWVRSHRYQNHSPLTYSSTQQLVAGSIIQVPLQKQTVAAIVFREVSKPQFACKPIIELVDVPALPASSLALFRWLQAYYPAPVGPVTQLFLPSHTIKNTSHDSPPAPQLTQPIKLNDEQTAAFQAINGSGTYLIHGRTGSGKTRLYAALAQQQLAQRRSVLICSPEISLTPQLVSNLEELLGRKSFVLHSKLTPKQRSDAWANIACATEPVVVIGPRSALFSPIHSLGLIVLDEAHEPAYKQEQQPYYYAPRVAAKLAQLHEAVLILGSATPPVSEYYLAEQKQRPILALHANAAGQEVSVQRTIVDIKDRNSFTNKSPHLSDPLIQAIKLALERGEQSMLYLNRRGTARLSLCQNCGWQAQCPHCDIPMTYHGDSHTLVCHTCGIKESAPTVCPVCAHADIVLRTAGTKAIADEAIRLFPEAHVQRFDTDNLKSERFEQHYKNVQQGNVDILVGTQLLAKGLDLPHLTTLGIILADSSLSIPDFTAQERTYQLIQQVMGRIGRGHVDHATAVVQTYNPDNLTLRAALDNDWQTFYTREIAERRQFNFPPFSHLLKLVCKRKSAAAAEKAAIKLADEFTHEFGNNLQVDGPTPAFHEKSGEYYHWQLVLRARRRSTLLTALAHVPASGWTYDIDPINLL